jgi:uncharacterized protein YlxW (UPF0749 family)
MSYQSPLNIVKGLTADENIEINDANLIRLRKKLLAELNLSGATTIEINKKSFSRDEIIKSIDVLLNNPDLQIHEFIYNNPTILNYLEDDTINLQSIEFVTLSIPENIRHQFGLIVYERIIIQFKKAMSTRVFAHADASLAMMKALPPDAQELCYEEVHRSLSTLSNYLVEIQHTVNLHHKNDLTFLTYTSFAILLNNLPEDFNDIKYDIVNNIINLLVAYHKLKKYDIEFALSISRVLVKINCDDDQKNLIKNNHRFFIDTVDNSSGSGISYIRYVGIGIFVLINLLRMCNSNSNSSRNYQFTSQNDNNILNIIEQQNNKYNNVNSTLKNYKNEVYSTSLSLASGKDNIVKLMFDSAHPVTGYCPFKNNAFYTRAQDFTDWDKTINIENQTKYDVIVFAFDSIKSKLISIYIAKQKSSEIRYQNNTHFMFYFGNHLMQPNSISSNQNFKLNELFFESAPKTTDFLNSNYLITAIKTSNSKKINTLKLDSLFLAEAKEEYVYKKFILKKTDN